MKPEIIQGIQEVSFFTLTGGTIGAAFGSIFGLYNRIQLKRILPITTFRTAAFFASVSAIQSTMEITRNRKDAWNSLFAGGWTGFIFGHGISRNYKYAIGLSLNAALLNWALQSFTMPSIRTWITRVSDSLNPVLLEEKSRPYKERIDDLRVEIEKLK